MRAGRVLRQIIIARIKDQVPGIPVIDKPTETTPMPYIVMGPSYWVDESVECIQTRTQTVQIDVYYEASNKGICEDTCDDITTALYGWSDTASLSMGPVYITLVRVMDDPDGGVHGVVQIEVRVES